MSLGLVSALLVPSCGASAGDRATDASSTSAPVPSTTTSAAATAADPVTTTSVASAPTTIVDVMVPMHSWARLPLVLFGRTDDAGEPPAGVVRQCTDPARPPVVLRATIGEGSRGDLPAAGTPVWAVVCAGVVGSGFDGGR